VFAGGASGLGVLLGPTGGFLVGFPVAAAVTGLVAHLGVGLTSPSDLPVSRIVAAVVAGSVAVYAFGAVGYAVAAGVGLVTAVLAVVVPFVPVALVKLVATVAVVRSDAVVAR
jgi:biotin transport system substrate-specific component